MEVEENINSWYILHVLSGHEYKVRENILRTSKLAELDHFINEVLVPVEHVSEVKKGKKTSTKRKFFPGYILMNIDLYESSGKINSKLWHFICEITSVIAFLGGDRPTSLPEAEVKDIISQIKGNEEKVKPKINFEIGEIVTIKEGAFANLEGNIDSIDEDRGKLRVMLSIFGRSTPVELEYWQVERSQ